MCDHGTCINTFGSYECDCDKGWEGPACEFDIDECALDRASQQNLVVPETVVVGETNSTDYNSDYVEVKQDVFVSTLCPDPNSQCRNLPGTYECICKGGWTKGEFSDLCDEDLDECKYNVCPGNAKCGTPEFNMFTCECPEEGCAFEN